MTARPMSFTRPIVALAIASASACSAIPRQEAEARPPVAVTVAAAVVMSVADEFEAGGIVQARTAATLAARILAPVRDVRVAPGDRVRSGQTLVVLDSRDLSGQTRTAEAGARAAGEAADAAAAEQQAADAERVSALATHTRLAGLHERRSATAQELDDATARLRAAEARVASAAARARAAASARDSALAASGTAATVESFAIVTAPFDGVITEKLVEPGNTVAPGTPLLRLEGTRAFEFHTRIDESRATKLSPGMAVTVVFDDAANGTPRMVQGTVAELARAVDTDLRAVLVKIALPNTESFPSGTFGRARLPMGTRSALTVPASSIVRRGQITSVFVVDNGVARLRLVNATDREILAGLAEGEIVVVVPPPGLVDGHPVTAGGQP